MGKLFALEMLLMVFQVTNAIVLISVTSSEVPHRPNADIRKGRSFVIKERVEFLWSAAGLRGRAVGARRVRARGDGVARWCERDGRRKYGPRGAGGLHRAVVPLQLADVPVLVLLARQRCGLDVFLGHSFVQCSVV